MTLTMDELALWRAVEADPDDEAARLVYADWLDKNGFPEKAVVLRCPHWRVGDDRTQLSRAKWYPDLHPRLVSMPGATPGVLACIRYGVVFLTSVWSGTAVRSLRTFADAIRQHDPNGNLLLVLFPTDDLDVAWGPIAEANNLVLGGNGEAFWVDRGRVIAVSRCDTPPSRLREVIEFLLRRREHDEAKA